MFDSTVWPKNAEMVLMVFAGEYDIACREALRAELQRIADFPQVVLDFTEVTYVDSGTVQELVSTHNARASSGLDPVTLVLQNGSLRRIFDLLDLSTVFRIVERLEDVVPVSNRNIALAYSRSGHIRRPGVNAS